MTGSSQRNTLTIGQYIELAKLFATEMPRLLSAIQKAIDNGWEISLIMEVVGEIGRDVQQIISILNESPRNWRTRIRRSYPTATADLPRSQVKYKMGWRPSLPDQRDFRYQVPRHVSASMPDALDLNNPPLPFPFNPSLDQSDLGRCGPTTLVEDILHRQFKSGIPMVMQSCLFLYWVTRYLQDTVNEDSGVDNRTMLKAFARFGNCDESTWRDVNEQFRVKPSQAAFDQAAGRIPFIKYEAVTQDRPTMMGCLADGKPFILGFTVYDSMLTPQIEQTGIIPYPSIRDSVKGGHDALAIGYNSTDQMKLGIPARHLKFKNHWYRSPGVPWGDGGYGYMPLSYAESSSLAGDFWTVTQVSGTPSPQPLPPGPQPLPPPGPPVPIPAPVPQDWQWLIDVIKMLLVTWGPLALPWIQKLVARLLLPPVVIAAINAWIENLIGREHVGKIAFVIEG